MWNAEKLDIKMLISLLTKPFQLLLQRSEHKQPTTVDADIFQSEPDIIDYL